MSAPKPDKHPQHAIRTGAAGVSYVESRMLTEGMIPCKPSIDVGYDIVCCFGDHKRRVQVKTTSSGEEGRSTTFCVKKNKSGISRAGRYLEAPSVSYLSDEFEAFVFVDLALSRCYVVPVEEINLSRHKISFDATSPWMEAWWVLREGKDANVGQDARP